MTHASEKPNSGAKNYKYVTLLNFTTFLDDTRKEINFLLNKMNTKIYELFTSFFILKIVCWSCKLIFNKYMKCKYTRNQLLVWTEHLLLSDVIASVV